MARRRSMMTSTNAGRGDYRLAASLGVQNDGSDVQEHQVYGFEREVGGLLCLLFRVRKRSSERETASNSAKQQASAGDGANAKPQAAGAVAVIFSFPVR